MSARQPGGNARQRRLIRRYVARLEAADLADMYGDPEAPPTVVRVARHVAELYRRTLRDWYRGRRPDAPSPRRRAAFGLRCSEEQCNRKAHMANPPLCRIHAHDDVPF